MIKLQIPKRLPLQNPCSSSEFEALTMLSSILLIILFTIRFLSISLICPFTLIVMAPLCISKIMSYIKIVMISECNANRENDIYLLYVSWKTLKI